jgi:uncharacterized protein (DUF58 family)
MKPRQYKTISFLDPAHLAPIRNLNLRAKSIVEGLIAGLHRSPYHGFSSEFLEYRPYRYGEPAAHIDWRKYARTQRSVVRCFKDETNLYARILVDTSASMRFCSTGSLSKFDYARTLAASLAWILIRQRDAVGLSLFNKEEILSLPPKGTNLQLKTVIACLEQAAPAQTTDCAAAVDRIARTIVKRGLCVVISDLFDETASIVKSLRHLKFKRQDVIVLRVLDPLELDFRYAQRLKISDVETGDAITVDGETAGFFYREGFGEHNRIIEGACRELAVDYAVISTRIPFQKALLRVLEKRRKLF